MPQLTRLIQSVPINLTSGTQTVNTLLDAHDLSMAKVIEAVLTLTTIATVVGTTLAVKLQEATYEGADGTIIWDTRGFFTVVPGNTAASASSPYMEGLNISQDVDLTTVERTYRPTGSNGGTELNAGTVRDGNIKPFLRHGAGTGSRHASWRVNVVETDAAASGSFVGQIDIYGHMWDL